MDVPGNGADGLTPEEFAGLMAPLGAWPAGRRVAVAVSGGADSLCLAVLAAGWGDPVALIVDHGLRAESAAEAALTAARLAGLGVPALILKLAGLARGPALAARARAARYESLTEAALQAGCLDLLLAHHLGDQAETLLMREAARSGPAGLACMEPVLHTHAVRLVRPLLAVPPGRLRATLRARGVGWVEDPSNQDPAAQRARIRAALGPEPIAAHAALAARASLAGRQRKAAEQAAAAWLAERAAVFSEGYAVLSPGALLPYALARLIQCIGGGSYPPGRKALARLAENPVPSVLGGVRLMQAGRLGPGLLVVREAARMQPPMAARPGTLWDGRFRMAHAARLPDGASIGAVGADAARLRAFTALPAVVLQTLPAVRVNGALAAVPHIGYPDRWTCAAMATSFAPARPAAGAPFGG